MSRAAKSAEPQRGLCIIDGGPEQAGANMTGFPGRSDSEPPLRASVLKGVNIAVAVPALGLLLLHVVLLVGLGAQGGPTPPEWCEHLMNSVGEWALLAPVPLSVVELLLLFSGRSLMGTDGENRYLYGRGTRFCLLGLPGLGMLPLLTGALLLFYMTARAIAQ
jgi:hypothetical protein